jgi:hypothetical protein
MSDRALSRQTPGATGGRNRRAAREIPKEADMQKFLIEREIPEVGSLERAQLKEAAARSNAVLAELAPDIQWVESYVADNKTFCVYLAKDEGRSASMPSSRASRRTGSPRSSG